MSIRPIDVKSGPVTLLKDTQKNMQWFSSGQANNFTRQIHVPSWPC